MEDHKNDRNNLKYLFSKSEIDALSNGIPLKGILIFPSRMYEVSTNKCLFFSSSFQFCFELNQNI
jgi:hypothetical protein